MSGTNDPLSILLSPTGVQCNVPDLAADPNVQKALEAMSHDESLMLAAQTIVAIVSRGLSMAGPIGAAAAYALTGRDMSAEIPAGVAAQLAAMQQAKLPPPPGTTDPNASSGGCPLSSLLQGFAQNPGKLFSDIQNLQKVLGQGKGT